jgi:ribonuclease HI
MKTLILYSDGGARGNPGPAAFGFVIQDQTGKVLKRESRYLGDKLTNNQAEYQGLIAGLNQALQMHPDFLRCFLDSELIVKQMKGDYKVKDPSLKNLFRKAQFLVRKIGRVEFQHIERERNKEADRLMNKELNLHIE